MPLRNLVRVLMFTNIKFEVDEDSGDVCSYVVFKLFHLSLAVFLVHIIMAIPIMWNFPKTKEHVNKLLSRWQLRETAYGRF